MDLVKQAYASSSESENEQEEQSSGAKTLPPVPSAVLDKFHIVPSVRDDSMKVSSFRHWVTFAYIEWRLAQKERASLDRLLSKCNSTIQKHTSQEVRFTPTYWSDLGSPRPLHISLCTNIVFKQAETRETFFKNVETAVEQSELKPFKVNIFPRPRVIRSLTNSGHFFLALPVDTCDTETSIPQLIRIIRDSHRDIDATVNFPFDESAIHVSIGSLNVSPESVNTAALNEALASHLTPEIPDFSFKATNIKMDRNRETLSVRFPEV